MPFANASNNFATLPFQTQPGMKHLLFNSVSNNQVMASVQPSNATNAYFFPSLNVRNGTFPPNICINGMGVNASPMITKTYNAGAITAGTTFENAGTTFSLPIKTVNSPGSWELDVYDLSNAKPGVHDSGTEKFIRLLCRGKPTTCGVVAGEPDAPQWSPKPRGNINGPAPGQGQTNPYVSQDDEWTYFAQCCATGPI